MCYLIGNIALYSFQNMKFSILIMIQILTLKQTHNENGSVTATSPHEMAVRIQPQRPIPLSDSSAAKKYVMQLFYGLSGVVLIIHKSYFYHQLTYHLLINLHSLVMGPMSMASVESLLVSLVFPYCCFLGSNWTVVGR